MSRHDFTTPGLIVAVLATVAVAAAAGAHAQPGGGDDQFISYIENSPEFSPTPTVSAVQAIIPLAHQVCDARASGLDDLQAAHLVWASKGVNTLGVAKGSVIGLETTALEIVEIATLAYCPQYDNSNY